MRDLAEIKTLSGVKSSGSLITMKLMAIILSISVRFTTDYLMGAH